MVRRGYTASPPPATRRSAPAHAPMPIVPARAAAPPPLPPAPMQAAPSTVEAPQHPSMFQQMAATAGGVAVGSAVGHAVNHGLTSILSGSSDKEVTPAAAVPAPAATAAQQNGSSAYPNEPKDPCSWEISQFLQCAQGQSDLTLCEGFNKALRQCKAQHHSQ